MQLATSLHQPVEADWSFHVVALPERLVAFRDRAYGEITAWDWDFGDGQRSSERHPLHRYQQPDEYIVTLSVSGPQGKARMKWI